MNPGLLPVLWIDVPPCRQAASTRSRRRGPCSPDGGTRRGSSRCRAPRPAGGTPRRGRSPAACRARSPLPSARTSSMSPVARTPVGPSPQLPRRPCRPWWASGRARPPGSAAGARSPAGATGCRCCRWPTARPAGRSASPADRRGHRPGPLASGQAGLVEHVLGQAHVGRVDEPAVAPDGADASASDAR